MKPALEFLSVAAVLFSTAFVASGQISSARTNANTSAIETELACSADTTVHLGNGIFYTTKVCQIEQSCLDVTPYVTPEELARSCCMNTVSENGRQMVTAGMFKISTCNYDDFLYPLVFHVPIPVDEVCGKDKNYKRMKLWDMGRNRRWGSQQSIKIVEIDSREYYQIELTYPRNVNLDYLLKPFLFANRPGSNIKVYRFKAKDGLTFNKLAIVQPFPTTKYDAKLNRKGDIAKVRVYRNDCRRDLLVSATAMNEKGDIFAIDPQPLHGLKKRWLAGWRQENTKGGELIAGFRHGNHKFYLKEGDFELKRVNVRSSPYSFVR